MSSIDKLKCKLKHNMHAFYQIERPSNYFLQILNCIHLQYGHVRLKLKVEGKSCIWLFGNHDH